jgi:hypothetical protein
VTVVWCVSLKISERLRGALSVVNGRAGDVAREPTQASEFAVAATINAGL